MSLKSLKRYAWFLIHNNRRNRFVARFARLCKNIHNASEHPGFDFNTNGETAVLERTVSGDAPVLFDAGANVGDWTEMAKGVFPNATVHAFELNPETATLLAKRMDGKAGVHVHAYGLAEKSGEVEFFAYSGEESVLSGLRSPVYGHVPFSKKPATVRTGDEVCRNLGITKIDYLKVDAEGADFEVLAGFGGMIGNQQIAVIQFEHRGGHFLREFYDFLGPKGYALGKLYANYVDFREHDCDMEDFLGPNYIAIPNSRTELLRTLKSGWKAVYPRI